MRVAEKVCISIFTELNISLQEKWFEIIALAFIDLEALHKGVPPTVKSF